MKKQRQFLLLFLLALILNPLSAFADEVILKSGQAFTLRIAGVPADEMALVGQRYAISDEGTIKLPYLKKLLSVAGLKPSQVARKIEAAYVAAEIYTAPTIQVDAQVSKRNRFVSVVGEVRNANTIEWVSNMTLLDAIASCGGKTDFAKMQKVKVMRAGKASYHDLRRGGAKENIKLLPGDIVTVP